jgi:Raf kinase inhibitor-like YbhB/YbcL family protein
VTSGQVGIPRARGGSRTRQQRGGSRTRQQRGGSRTRQQRGGSRTRQQRGGSRTRQRRGSPRRPSRCAAVVLALAAALALAGCGQAGQGATVAPRVMSVGSEAFEQIDQQYILPQRYTCHGAKVNPALDWSGAPANTKSLALIVDDSSAPINPFIYWLVFDIQPGTTDMQEGSLPTGARQALNSAGTMPYDAPCPSGHSHWYRFTVYALDRTLTLPDGAPLLKAWTAVANATIGRGRIVVLGYP